MGVYIKGIEMPSSCRECPLESIERYVCSITGKAYNWGLKTRPTDCPLVEIPPHGRLIDADALKDKPVPINGYFDYERDVFVHYPPTYMQAIDDIVNAPTIIEAEGGE